MSFWQASTARCAFLATSKSTVSGPKPLGEINYGRNSIHEPPQGCNGRWGAMRAHKFAGIAKRPQSANQGLSGRCCRLCGSRDCLMPVHWTAKGQQKANAVSCQLAEACQRVAEVLGRTDSQSLSRHASAFAVGLVELPFVYVRRWAKRFRRS